MTRRFALIALLFALTSAQTTTQSKQISLDPNAGPLKLRIVFQSEQPPQVQQTPCSTGNCQPTPTLSPCASGNCGSVQPVQASPCSTGNCGVTQQASACSTGNCNGPVAGSANVVPVFDASIYTTTTPMPIPIRTISSNTAPIKVIRVPSYSNSNNGCFSPPCGAPRFIFAQPPCFGNSCGPRFMFPRRRHFFGPRPIIIGNRNNGNINAGGNVAVPDTIYKNGMAIRAPIRVPSSYQDGNPVFNSGK
ncbi:CC domain-containing protein [Caenorhabditis elegans]|uniref:CC domain-containing protein n=1 Tax=Caenorhabditis elegans TaxID=6239 RepID=Q19618_CAEEL|nr:CC domain-containing protein [Caenorhabditis elegans]CAA93463.3 CC domain-containing protein [Caenorhabditis elegans]|eukprot:NP_502311.3 Uncharacterized protein CELE_F20B10.3 [Caenorhabditis elegans]